MKIITFRVDDLDYDAIHNAVAYRQSLRVNGECILPEGESELLGAILAEICRDWREYMERERKKI